MASLAMLLATDPPAGRALLAAGLFLALCCSGAIGVSTNGLAIDKTAELFLLTGLIFLAPLLAIRTQLDLQTFLNSVLIVGIVALALFAVSPASQDTYSGVLVIDGSNSIGTARILGAAIVITLSSLLFSKHRAPRTLVLIASSGALLAAMLATGSRGPVVSLILALLVCVIFSPGLRGRRLGPLFTLGLASLAGVGGAWLSGFRGLDRIERALLGGSDSSIDARTRLWEIAIEEASKSFWGQGWSAFGDVDQVRAAGYGYPHNLPLEILVEAGIVGLALFLAILLAGVLSAMRQSSNFAMFALAVLLVYTLGNAMVSGDINDNRLLWATVGAALAMSSKPEHCASRTAHYVPR